MPILRKLLGQDGVCGVVALRDDQLVGYLCGSPELHSPTRTFAGFMSPRATEIPYAGYAMAAGEESFVLHALYGALARDWVAQDLRGHYVTVPDRADLGELWANLGFGRFLALGIRPTTPAQGSPPPGMTVRRASREDEALLQSAMTAFFRTFADPPIFVPFLPETAAERQRYVADHLVDPTCPIWLACDADGSLLGFQLFVEPTSPHWGISALETPPRALYLNIAYTAEGHRSAGVGAALLQQTMAWAHAAGYTTCLAHWVTASRAAHFWQRQGFRPLTYWLCRTVDARASWAVSSA